MKDPPHPGEIIREEVIRPLGLSVTEAASALGVTRQALSAFLNERSDLSPEMALRIEVALGPKADVMMGIQTDYEMARARARLPEITATVRRIIPSTSLLALSNPASARAPRARSRRCRRPIGGA